MGSTSKLQVTIYIVVIFIVLFVVAVVMGIVPGLQNGTSGASLVVWGPYPAHLLQDTFNAYQEANRGKRIFYVEKGEQAIARDLAEAIATGSPPDMVLLPDTLLHSTKNKLSPVPAIVMTEREFLETFATLPARLFIEYASDENETETTIYGIPLAMDPLVLYWNRDLFASEAIAEQPRTWDQFLTAASRLTKRTADGNITRAGAAMGLATNIPHAKDIVSLLILQGGTSIIDPQTKEVTLGESRLVNNINISPTESSLRYYTDFARREKTSYSWNHTFPDPLIAFSREDLAMFVGFAHSRPTILTSNTHLNLGVSPVPQYTGSPQNIDYARSIAMVVPLASKNQVAAWQSIQFLTSPDMMQRITNALSLAPARRDVLGKGHTNPALSVIYEEALRSRAWYDPDAGRTNAIFQNMIESALANRDIGSVVSDARARLTELMK